MPNERDDEPKIKIIDRRMLSAEERTGKGPLITSSTPEPAAVAEDRPKLEIIGGGRPTAPAAPVTPEDPSQAFQESVSSEEEMEEPLTDKEAAELRSQIEEEQFAVLEQQFGRPLTDAERDQVRAMMDQQAQSMTNLEVAPMLLRSITELPSYAVVHLGLRPNPYTGLIARNDAEARLAIDAFGSIYEIIKNKVDARAGAELARVLNDLRANYTRITGAQIVPPGGPRIIL